MKILKISVLAVNLLCIAWLTFLVALSPARVKPLEAMIANKYYDKVVPFGKAVVTKQANDFYVPVLLVLAVNIIYLVLTTRKESNLNKTNVEERA